MDSLAQLGVPPGSFQKRSRGFQFIGVHLLLDMWGASALDDPFCMESGMRESAAACGAHLLKLDLHHFGVGGGVTGVAILAESHITVHSWPEHGFAAFDVFVCGSLDPYPAIEVLTRLFTPARIQLTEHRRGLSPCA